MNGSLIIFVLVGLVTLACSRSAPWPEAPGNEDPNLVHHPNRFERANVLQERNADNQFNQCCIAKNISRNCRNNVCNFTAITRTEPITLIRNYEQCREQAEEIFECATNMRNQQFCCASRSVPDECLQYCDGTARLRTDERSSLCLIHLGSILNCLKRGFRRN